MDIADRIAGRLTVESAAERLASRYGGPPSELDAIAQTVGILGIALGEIEGSAVLNVGPLDGTFAVILRRNDPFVRRRFSLAHEIAHLALGIRGDETRYRGRVAARSESNAEERACDYFAACLLMPRPWVLALAVGNVTPRDLARAFDVSLPAMRSRLNELGLHAVASRAARR